MNRMKRFLAVTLSAVTALTSVPAGMLTAEAEETANSSGEQTALDTDYSFSGTNTFGDMLSEDLEAEAEAQEDGTGYSIFAAEVSGSQVTLEYEALEDCTLVTAIYDDDGIQMLASGQTEVSAEETETTVQLEIDTMPTYFYLKAYLIETDTLKPLCNAYDNPDYTQDMQELFAMKTTDFDEERVLSLDGSTDNNFAVYAEDVVALSTENGVNQLTAEDDETRTYQFENADETLTGLSAGDIFSTQDADGELLIVKVAEISQDGTTVTITSDEMEMEDAFEYVKIDGAAGATEDDYSTDGIGEGVTYEGVDTETDTDSEESSTEVQSMDSGLVGAWDEIEGSASDKLEFKIDDPGSNDSDSKDSDSDDSDSKSSISITGDVTLSLELGIDYYISRERTKIDFSLKNSIGVNVSLKASGESAKELSFGTINVEIVPGVNVGLTPKLKFEVSATLTISDTINSSVTISANKEKGKGWDFSRCVEKPKSNLKLEIEGSLYIGVALEPNINIISPNICKFGTEAEVGLELSMKEALDEEELEEKNPDKKHECGICFEGDLSVKQKIGVSFTFLKIVKVGRKWMLSSKKISNIYYSDTYDEFGFTTCPHYLYKTEIQVLDSSGNQVKTATLKMDGASNTVVLKDGVYDTYLTAGKHTVAVTTSTGLTGKKSFQLQQKPTLIQVQLENMNDSGTSAGTTTATTTIATTTETTTTTATTAITQTSYTYGDLTYRFLEDGTIEITDCDNDATSVDIPAEIDGVAVTSIGENAFEVDSIYHNLVDVTIPDSVTSIGYCAFRNCSSLIDITIPGSVTSIGDSAFSNCTGIENITILDGVTSIGDLAFCGCTSLTGITIPNSVTSIGNWAFSECTRLTSIVIPDSVTSIGDYMFNECTSLTDIAIPDDVTNIGNYAFYHCSRLTSIVIPDSVINIGPSAFLQCTKLADITIPESVTSIGGLAFVRTSWLYTKRAENPLVVVNGILIDGQTCKGDVVIPNNVTNIGACAFYKCTDITSITIPESVTSIERSAFFGCTNLTCITIPDSVTSIEWCAFDDCTSLTNVYYTGTEEQWNSIAIDEYGNDDLTSDTIHYNSTGTSEISTASLQTANLVGESASATDGDSTYQTALFTDLTPGEVYNFYVLKDDAATSLLAPDNLLCLQQYTADDSGTVTATYLPRETWENPAVFLVGMAHLELNADTTSVTVEDLTYTGSAQQAVVTVTYDGTVLTPGVDYDLADDFTATDAGEYTVTVIGIGNYTGEISQTYHVVAAGMTGDADQDGEITTQDAYLVLLYYSNHAAGDASYLLTGDAATDETVLPLVDIDSDGSITTQDAFYILKFYSLTAAGSSPTWEGVMAS